MEKSQPPRMLASNPGIRRDMESIDRFDSHAYGESSRPALHESHVTWTFQGSNQTGDYSIRLRVQNPHDSKRTAVHGFLTFTKNGLSHHYSVSSNPSAKSLHRQSTSGLEGSSRELTGAEKAAIRRFLRDMAPETALPAESENSQARLRAAEIDLKKKARTQLRQWLESVE